MDYKYKDFTEDYNIIRKSNLFDAEWYLSNYEINSDSDPLTHFLMEGSPKFYNPSPDFDVQWYLTEYDNEEMEEIDPDIFLNDFEGALTGKETTESVEIHPLVHYIRFGRYEGRFPKPYSFDLKYKRDFSIILKSGLFDKEWFSNCYSLDGDVDPIYYYLVHGVELGLNPSPDFDTMWYLEEYGGDLKQGMDPLVHYIEFGQDEGKFPKQYLFDLKYKSDYFTILKSGLFDKEWFSNCYSLDGDVDPIYYYLVHGVELGLNPSPDFDTMWYLEEYGGDLKQGMNPLVHYIKYGVGNRLISKLYDFDEINRLDLNKTIKGKNDYLFLINDRTNEIRQHFDDSFISQFKNSDFTRDYYFKKNLFEKINLKYYYFIVPDKSIVCKDWIPFRYDVIKRNVAQFNFIPDFKDNLIYSDYWRYDSHINFKGAKKLAFDYLKYIDNSFTEEQYENLISECNIRKIIEWHDLLSALNWSYTEKEKKGIKLSQTEVYFPKLNKLDIPNEFLKVGRRDSEYFYNPDSVTNLRVLIFRDSSTKFLKFYLSLYFREIFLYWDHFRLSKELIDWFKPDVILEIRTERFMEDYFTPIWLQKLMSDK